MPHVICRPAPGVRWAVEDDGILLDARGVLQRLSLRRVRDAEFAVSLPSR
jgi:hypothetical protein